MISHCLLVEQGRLSERAGRTEFIPFELRSFCSSHSTSRFSRPTAVSPFRANPLFSRLGVEARNGMNSVLRPGSTLHLRPLQQFLNFLPLPQGQRSLRPTRGGADT